MNEDVLLTLGREALWLMILVSLPPVGASLLVGFLASLFQATTQLQESSLSVVPKLAATVMALLLAGPWISAELSRFATQVLELLPEISL